MYADIILDVPQGANDRLFTYQLTGDLARTCEPGDRLAVSFGSKTRIADGIIWKLSEEKPSFEVKPALAVLPKAYSFSETQMKLLLSLRKTCLATYRQAYRLLIPTGYSLKTEKTYIINEDGLFQRRLGEVLSESRILRYADKLDLKELIKDGKIEEKLSFDVSYKSARTEMVKSLLPDLDKALSKIRNGAKKQENIIKYVYSQGETEYSALRKACLATRADVKKLEALGIIRLFEVNSEGGFESDEEKGVKKPEPALNQDQKRAYDIFEETVSASTFRAIINGVTGSGKTRLYIECAKKIIASGKQVLLLVPEIALTTQLVNRIRDALDVQIAVIHAYVSPREKQRAYNEIKQGRAKLVIGARSALFAPFDDLGMIIIDESHEKSYRSESVPRYDAVKLAIDLSESMGIHLALGSATTTLEHFEIARRKNFLELKLNRRTSGVEAPEIKVIDLASVKIAKGKISEILYEKLKTVFERGEKAMILHNRRGYHAYRQCMSCGHIEKCINCDVSLQVKSRNGDLKCKYCDYSVSSYSVCSKCGKPVTDIMPAVLSVKETLEELFPDRVIESVDSDTTRNAENYKKILKAFEAGEIDCLCGTQVIAKGLDFDDVTFAAVLDADQIINIPDYMAAERAFQLMYQLAGRAGRRKERGEVYLQTGDTRHRVIRRLLANDYEGFIKEERVLRKLLAFPPFAILLALRFVSEDNDKARAMAEKAAGILKAYTRKNGLRMQVFGAKEDYHLRIKNRYNYYVLVKANNEDEKLLHALLYNSFIVDKYDFLDKDVSVSLDFDPEML